MSEDAKIIDQTYFENLRDSIRVREVTVTRTLKTEVEDFGAQFTAEIDGCSSDAAVCLHLLGLRADLTLLSQAKVVGAVSEDFARDQIISIKKGYASLISEEMARLAAQRGGENDGT